ncbi:MAG: hypothetical protein ACYTGC_15470 [Planctomycetota bacterium]|jgi:hypothetical protein
MEIHRQQCQACGSHDVHNILARETGRPQTVYVRCARCRDLVARYLLSGYYHHGKDVDSYLRSLGHLAAESGRDTLEDFKQVQNDAIEGFERVLEHLKSKEEE